MTEIALEQFKQAILAHYPDLCIVSISFLGEGWANRLCLVNKTLIFRFPLDSNSEQQLLREIRLLPVLSPELPLPIPEYKYITLNSEKYPFAFVGYEQIPGVSIPQPSDTLRQATWWRLQAGAFLTALHRIPIGKVRAVGLEGYPTAQAWREALTAKHAPYERYVCPLLPTAQCKAILSYLEKSLNDERMVAFSPVVLHQDFDFHNFLVDLERQQITGVLDFGSISIGDPAVDISPEIQPYYRGRIDTGWDFRRDYYKRTGALEDLLYIRTCGHEIPNQEAVQGRKLKEIARIWS
ncbi:MAG: phosphotransferase [Anaerolineae bacterium]|nr:phosphotransferase [Anaerolineae bacterium]